MRVAALAMVVAAILVGCAASVQAAPAMGTPAMGQPRPAVEQPASAAPAATATSAPASTATPVPDPTPTPDATMAPSPDAPATATPAPPVLVPLVPVTGFWSTERSITRSALAAAVAGSGTSPRRVLVSRDDLAALAASLGVRPGSNVRALAAADVRAQLAATPSAIGILRAEDVTPRIRALAVDGVSLFGGNRARTLAAWTLLVAEPAGSRTSAFDPAAVWTMVAGGDVMLDRSVYRRAILQGKGVDYPWNGGIARITSRFCCGWPGMRLVRAERVGPGGAVRTLIRRADVAVVNLEGPAPDDPVHRMYGLVFTMDPRLLAGVRRAGVDAVSLANNHIRNDGSSGVRQTLRNLDEAGLRHFGAGRDLAAARRPAWFTAAGTRIALLGYNGIGTAANATASRPGAAPLALRVLRADIRAARRAGADVVVVMPHWGAEYTDRITAQQRTFGREALEAGADLVLGNHSHWAGPIGIRGGNRLVVYSMGDLLFDLNHDERTQEAFLVETTFAGNRLLQVTLHPTVIVGQAQLNLLAPGGGGTRLLRAIQAASQRLGAP
jgi:poly-gamma-glutamate capsule biosynthesis protein CapA/YwtB (metallophosphatase superfamily)